MVVLSIFVSSDLIFTVLPEMSKFDIVALLVIKLVVLVVPLTSNVYKGGSIDTPNLPHTTTLEPSIIPPLFSEFK